MLKIDLPQPLQDEFERTAKALYKQGGVARAFVEAVELWLAQHRIAPVEAEQTANDQAYLRLKDELERAHRGKWVVIAHGQLQGVGLSLEEVGGLASTAHDRIVMLIGADRPKEIELGWQMAFG